MPDSRLHIPDSGLVQKVMIRVPNWVGDAVMAEPALRQLRRIFKESRLTYVARPWVEGLFEGENLYDDLIAVSPSSGLLASGKNFINEVRALKERNFDFGLLLTNSFGTALSSRLAGVGNLAGYATDGRGALLHTLIPFAPGYKTRHQVFYYLNLAKEIEQLLTKDTRIDLQGGQPELQATRKSLATARRLLEEAGLVIQAQASEAGKQRQALDDPVLAGRQLPIVNQESYGSAQGQNPHLKFSRRLVALNPGATNSRAKQWPAEKFAALADRLARADDFQSVIVGAPGDVEVANRVQQLMQTPVANLAGRTTIAELKGVLQLAALVISNDTGAAHVAAALGLPTVVVFGPTEHFATRPLANLAAVVRHNVECSPCMLKDCPIDHRCMTRVQIADVYKAAKRLLAD